ncbi:MAG: recombinase family protein [Yaniella sp.]|uniref:recombinase family protein n=1 Tax=Yaniella sp. TaxID=2773929 RepID=UPI003F96AB77
MLIGYMRVSKADGSQTTDLQRDALLSAGVDPEKMYEEKASGMKDDRPERGVGLKVLTGQGAAIDTTTFGKLVFGIFAALAEFERELISERTKAGLTSARARGRKGGRHYKMTAAKVRLAADSMGQPGTKVGELCKELGVTRQTLYRHVSPTGDLRPDGARLLSW